MAEFDFDTIITAEQMPSKVANFDVNFEDTKFEPLREDALFEETRDLLGRELFSLLIDADADRSRFDTLLDGEKYTESDGKKDIFIGLRKIIAIIIYIRAYQTGSNEVTNAGNTLSNVTSKGTQTFEQTEDTSDQDKKIKDLRVYAKDLDRYLNVKSDIYPEYNLDGEIYTSSYLVLN